MMSGGARELNRVILSSCSYRQQRRVHNIHIILALSRLVTDDGLLFLTEQSLS